MRSSADNRSRTLLAEGWRALEAGHAADAAIVFERVLLHDGESRDARAGLEQARAAVSEHDLKAAATDEAPVAGLARGGFDPPLTDIPAADSEDRPIPAVSLSWSRSFVVAAWVTLFGVLGTGVAVSWTRLVDTLVRRPTAAGGPVAGGESSSRQADAAATPGGTR